MIPIPTGVEAIFFDAVGTLIHPEPPAPAVYAAVGGRHGSRHTAAEIAIRFRAAFGREEAVDLAAGLRTSEARELERWHRIVGSVLDDVRDPRACFAELFAHFGRPDGWRWEPDLPETLDALSRRGLVLGTASNYDCRLWGVLTGVPLSQRLTHVVISSEVGWRKPAPEFFAALCRQCRRRPEQILFVGDDRANDFDGARAAGLHALLFDRHGKETALPRIERLADLVTG